MNENDFGRALINAVAMNAGRGPDRRAAIRVCNMAWCGLVVDAYRRIDMPTFLSMEGYRAFAVPILAAQAFVIRAILGFVAIGDT